MNTIDITTAQVLSEVYFLDIEMIDKQHSKFFVLFDKLTEVHQSGKTPDNKQILEMIDELEKYTHIHFQTEEALMRKANYPDIEHHMVQHKIFVDKVKEFRLAFNYKNVLLVQQMISFMRKWFLMHITETDNKYVEPVKAYMQSKESE